MLETPFSRLLLLCFLLFPRIEGDDASLCSPLFVLGCHDFDSFAQLGGLVVHLGAVFANVVELPLSVYSLGD